MALDVDVGVGPRLVRSPPGATSPSFGSRIRLFVMSWSPSCRAMQRPCDVPYRSRVAPVRSDARARRARCRLGDSLAVR